MCPHHIASAMLSPAVLDRADDFLRQRNRFDEHLMPHAKTLASGLKELNCAAAKPTRPSREIDQRCLQVVRGRLGPVTRADGGQQFTMIPGR